MCIRDSPPVFTLGTAADNSHVLDPKEIPIVQSDRGGEVTYHGPGQLIIYFLLDITHPFFTRLTCIGLITYVH